MAGYVLDASVFIAAHVPSEKHHLAARALMKRAPEDVPFLVPAIFELEVVAALARRGARLHQIASVEVALQTGRYVPVAIDATVLTTAVDVAKKAALRAYDSVYAAVAIQNEAALLTIDVEFVERFHGSFPHVEVITV